MQQKCIHGNCWPRHAGAGCSSLPFAEDVTTTSCRQSCVVAVNPFFRGLSFFAAELRGCLGLRPLQCQALESHRRLADEGLAVQHEKSSGRISAAHVREHRGAVPGGPGHDWAEARLEGVPSVGARHFSACGKPWLLFVLRKTYWVGLPAVQGSEKNSCNSLRSSSVCCDLRLQKVGQAKQYERAICAWLPHVMSDCLTQADGMGDVLPPVLVLSDVEAEEYLFFNICFACVGLLVPAVLR